MISAFRPIAQLGEQVVRKAGPKSLKISPPPSHFVPFREESSEKYLFKGKTSVFDSKKFKFGPVAQLGVQAGQLYAPCFGGVTRMVAIRFASQKT